MLSSPVIACTKHCSEEGVHAVNHRAQQLKGILLAGGSGSRLAPLTAVTSKQLLPVYDKPLVYYPLSTLMLAGIRDILVISTPEELPRFCALLGDGSRFGLTLRYCAQPSPDGLAQAFLLAEDYLARESCAMVLGDNLFHGGGLGRLLRRAAARAEESARATVFACRVRDPERFGVVSFDESGRAVSLAEKPSRPGSPYAVTGLYFYPPGVSGLARTLRPSARGELEITELNSLYLARGLLDVELLGRGAAWLDAGTPESLFEAGAFVRMLQLRQGLVLSCPEEIAYRSGWIGREELLRAAAQCAVTSYGEHLLALAEGSLP